MNNVVHRCRRHVSILALTVVVGTVPPAVAQVTRYVAPSALGNGSGSSAGTAASYLNATFWSQIQTELASQPVTVKFLDGGYTGGALELRDMGDRYNRLTLQGNTANGAVFNGSRLHLYGVQNATLSQLRFTGNYDASSAVGIQSNGYRPSRNLLIDSCSWIDLPGLRNAGLALSYFGTYNVEVKNSTFQRAGVGTGYHHIYIDSGPKNISLIDNLFEDSRGSYVRFRDNSDYGTIVGNTFRATQAQYNRPFLQVATFNDINPGDENLGTHFLVANNQFISTGGGVAMGFSHDGYDPVGYQYLLTAAEGQILENGKTQQKKQLLWNNVGIDGDAIRVRDNQYTNITYKGSFSSSANYGSLSKGWVGPAHIDDVFNTNPNTTLSALPMMTNSLFTSPNGEFAVRGWGGTAGKPHPRLDEGPGHAVRLDSSIKNTVEQRLFDTPSSWQLDLSFATAPPSSSSFASLRIVVSHDSNSQGAPGNITLYIDNLGRVRLVGLAGSSSGTNTVSGLGTIAFSSDADGNGSFADPGDTLNVYKLRIVGDYSNTPTFSLFLSEPNSDVLTRQALGLNNFRYGVPLANTGPQYLAFETWYSDGDFVVDSPIFSLAGDYNHDGVVDVADYVAWRDTDGTSAGYNLWRANFGKSASNSAAAAALTESITLVPEPSSLGLCVLHVLVLVAVGGLRCSRAKEVDLCRPTRLSVGK